MFGNAEFIAASRHFVCVRIDTYESEENERLVRDMMRGALVNTTFCLLAPDGDSQLSGVGRSVFGPFASAEGLNRVARSYTPEGEPSEAMIPDFHSLRSALNVASADGRPLVVVAASGEEVKAIEKRLRPVVWHEDIVGRFHFDLEIEPETLRGKLTAGDGPIDGKPSYRKGGIYVVQPDAFGLRGDILLQLDTAAGAEEIRAGLLKALEKYVALAQRKTYEAHVAEGRRRGIYLEMPVAYGEDRDADGEIDPDHAARFNRLRRSAERSGELIPIE